MAQAKRIQVVENTALTPGNAQNVILEVPTDLRMEANYHNIWASFTAEPEDAGANGAGTWVLYIIKEGGSAIAWSDITVNAENNNWFIIACGVWSAANEAPYTSPPIHPQTSRTLNPGDKLALAITVTGLTVGQFTVRAMLCAHVTRK